jgi:hypothetical protein
MDKETEQFKRDLLESVRQMNEETRYLLATPANARHLAELGLQKLPMTDAELEAWESSRDMASELEKSVREMFGSECVPIKIKRL